MLPGDLGKHAVSEGKKVGGAQLSGSFIHLCLRVWAPALLQHGRCSMASTAGRQLSQQKPAVHQDSTTTVSC